jgi:energy-converting hydrogenase Eha subunit F
VARSTAITTSHHGDYYFGHLPPTATLPGKLLRHPRNLVIVELFSSPILFATGVHFSPVLLHNQGYPKVCPDSLNLPNTGDPLPEYHRYLPVLCSPRPGTYLL